MTIADDVYVLMQDTDQTTPSFPWPTGFAVATEKQAIEWVAQEPTAGCRSWCKVTLVDGIPQDG